jgi:cyanate permease
VLFAVVGCNVHLPSLLSDHGATAGQIAAIVAAGAVGSVLGRLFTGVMLDRFSVRLVAAIFFLGQVLGFFLLLDGVTWALPAGLLLGAVQGAEIDMLGFVVARRFGRTAYARIVGACFGLTLVGAITGPLVMGKIFDRTGSYDLGLMVFPLFPVLALGLLWLAKFSPPAQPAPVLQK